MKKKVAALVLTALFGGMFMTALPVTSTYARLPDEDQQAQREAEQQEQQQQQQSSDPEDPCNLAMGSKPPGMCDEEHTEETLIDTISNVLDTVYLWVGIIAVIFIIIGGINYTMSQGDPGKVKKAKDTVLYGIIGLIIALLAFAITAFVMNAMEGNV